MDIVDELRARLLPRGPAGREAILDHPLDERLAHHRARVVEAGGRAHALAHVGRGARRDAVDHRARARDVRIEPCEQLDEAAPREECAHAGAKARAVVAQVVAALQRERARAARGPFGEKRGERAVDREARALQVGREIGVRHVEPIVLVEVVAAFRHRERHDPARRRGARVDERGQLHRPRQHARDRADRLVGALALRRDRLERVDAVLRGERLAARAQIVADVADDERPPLGGGRRFVDAVQIPRLMRAVKRADADVQDRRRGGGRTAHPVSPDGRLAPAEFCIDHLLFM